MSVLSTQIKKWALCDHGFVTALGADMRLIPGAYWPIRYQHPSAITMLCSGASRRPPSVSTSESRCALLKQLPITSLLNKVKHGRLRQRWTKPFNIERKMMRFLVFLFLKAGDETTGHIVMPGHSTEMYCVQPWDARRGPQESEWCQCSDIQRQLPNQVMPHPKRLRTVPVSDL